MVEAHGADQGIAQKLARVAKMHFAKQRYSATGPRLPDREAMFNKLLQSPAILAAIEDEAQKPKSSPEKARKEAEKILDEIAANVRHESFKNRRSSTKLALEQTLSGHQCAIRRACA